MIYLQLEYRLKYLTLYLKSQFQHQKQSRNFIPSNYLRAASNTRV